MHKNIFIIALTLIAFSVQAQTQSCCSSKATSTKSACCSKSSAANTGSEEPLLENTDKKTLMTEAELKTTPQRPQSTSQSTEIKTEHFRVYGNCSMCEQTIEGSLKNQEGVVLADWDKETDQMTVKYDPNIISLDNIKQKIADVGYDSDTHRAKDEVYNNLHGCCQYERPKKISSDL